jgi:phosphatidylserine/phosphatidylglycerophosphate/cardiolipin synthase-like enzyme
MGLGSYNWSSSGEFRNFENIMIFHGEVPQQQKIIDAFMYEYKIIWNAIKKEQVPITSKIVSPQVVPGYYGRELKKNIIKVFSDGDCKKIMAILDNNASGYTEKALASLTGLKEDQLKNKLQTLEKATLIFMNKQKEDVFYCLAD